VLKNSVSIIGLQRTNFLSLGFCKFQSTATRMSRLRLLINLLNNSFLQNAKKRERARTLKYADRKKNKHKYLKKKQVKFTRGKSSSIYLSFNHF
jgi:hypothetical protein